MIARFLRPLLCVLAFGSLQAHPCCKPLAKADCKAKTDYAHLPERLQQYYTGFPNCEYLSEMVPEAKLFFRTQGKFSTHKPTIVFVHGFGETGAIWKAAQQELSDEYYTVAFDLRGFGKSSKTTPSPLPGGIHYTTDMYVEDIVQLLSYLGIDQKVVLVGHSLGGTYAIKFAATYPEKVAKLALVGTFPFITPDCAVADDCATSCLNPATCEEGFCYPFGISQSTATGLFQPLTTCLADGGTEKECLAVQGEFMAPLWYNELCQCELKKAQEALVEAVVSNTPGIIFNFVANALSENILNSLPDVAAPTLITYGSDDIVVNPGNSFVIHDAITNSVLVEFAGKGHQPHVTDYQNFISLLRCFIESCKMADFTKVFDEGCCVDPLARPKKCD